MGSIRGRAGRSKANPVRAHKAVGSGKMCRTCKIQFYFLVKGHPSVFTKAY